MGIYWHSVHQNQLSPRPGKAPTLLCHPALLLLLHPCLYFQAVKNQSQAELVDEEAMSQIRKGHETMCVVLTSRHKNLDTVRAVWSTGDIKARMWRYLRLTRGAAEQLCWLVWGRFCLLHKMQGLTAFVPRAAPQSAAVSHLRLNDHKEMWRKLSGVRVIFSSLANSTFPLPCF